MIIKPGVTVTVVYLDRTTSALRVSWSAISLVETISHPAGQNSLRLELSLSGSNSAESIPAKNWVTSTTLYSANRTTPLYFVY